MSKDYSFANISRIFGIDPKPENNEDIINGFSPLGTHFARTGGIIKIEGSYSDGKFSQNVNPNFSKIIKNIMQGKIGEIIA